MTGEPAVRTCGECREVIAADPRSPRIDRHVAECAACRAWRDEMLALDAEIARALAVPVPELRMPELPNLADYGVTAIDRARKRRVPAGAWLALAASLTLAVALGLRFAADGGGTATPLGDEILAHIDHESFSLVVSDQPVGNDRLARVLPATVARLAPDAPLVTYAQSCQIHGHPVPHLVVQGAHGPVTILLMPEETIEAPQEFGDGVLEGIVLPVGEGSIAIVGQDRRDLRQLEETMKKSVTWRT